MDLRSHYPFWLLRHGIINSYPSLQKNERADVAVIGAGISGALAARQLCEAGLNVIILDRRHAGMGSTAASTALLQYEIDTPLHKLIDLVGEQHAVKSYLLCRDAILKLSDICKELDVPGLFEPKPSFQYASYKNHVTLLKKEFAVRKKAGIAVQWLDESEIQNKFGFVKHGGLLSKHGAEADAYKITHAILEKYQHLGLKVYDNTDVTDIRHKRSGIELVVAGGWKVAAKKLVIACGYESQQYLSQQVQRLHSTYAIASEPLADRDFWYKNALIWETAVPYLYLRTTSDCRVIIGGKDIPQMNAHKRDQKINAKLRHWKGPLVNYFPG
jgi:glycine/D-amino acid oxidase-like deaminating enzyme